MRKDVDDAITEGIKKQYSSCDDNNFLESVYVTDPEKKHGLIIQRKSEGWNIEYRKDRGNRIEVSRCCIPFKGRRDTGHGKIEIDQDLLDYRRAMEELPDGFLDIEEDEDREDHAIRKYYRSLSSLRDDMSSAINEREPDEEFNQFKDESFLLD